MNKFNLTIKYTDNILHISDLPTSQHSKKQLTECYHQISTTRLNKVKEVVLNLNNYSNEDLIAVAF
jgi:hypothetical protein